VGGKFHLKLNTDERPIANKYREGKMKRTLKRESKELEIVWRVTVFEQCGRGTWSGFARSPVLVSHSQFVWLSGGQKWSGEGSPPRRMLSSRLSCLLEIEAIEASMYLLVSLAQDMNEMLKITPS
jgi:hypothetical protein